LLYRYSNIEFILNLNINDGVKLLNKCRNENFEEKAWQMYLAVLPPDESGKKIKSFDSFLKTMKSSKKVELTDDEIMRKCNKIKEKHQKRRLKN
jgi:hypothetical protein